MTPPAAQQFVELDLARRLFSALAITPDMLRHHDRPDVLASVGGRTIGIEVTVYHADEQPDGTGSPARSQEHDLVRQAEGKPYFMCVPSDPLPGLVARISDKVRKAEDYNMEGCDELWLLIAASVPMTGAVASTHMFDFLLNAQALNERTDYLLNASPFKAAYVHSHLSAEGEALFSWSRAKRWSRVT